MQRIQNRALSQRVGLAAMVDFVLPLGPTVAQASGVRHACSYTAWLQFAACGEEAKDFEYFDGDDPPLPELVEIEGSFKAGRDGDKSGTLFMGTPIVGAKYRQEWSPSNAEDVAEVLSTTYGYGSDARFDPLISEDLVELLCDDDCVVTADTSPLEPDTLEYAFYARGVGFFFEVKPEEGESLQIVECNVDPKCDELPEL
jgi:hypothetical protein